MKKFATYDEIENLCEAMIKDFMKRKHYTNAHCVDIEAFVTEYLGIPIVYFSSMTISKLLMEMASFD